MYLDFWFLDKKVLKIVDFIPMLIFLHIYYYIFKIQILMGFILFFPSLLFTIKSKKSIIFNIFIYLPYIIIKSLKKIKISKENFKVIFINFLFIYMWNYPRVCFYYSFKSLLIIKSYKNDPEIINIKKLKEILICLYDNTYKEVIDKVESTLYDE